MAETTETTSTEAPLAPEPAQVAETTETATPIAEAPPAPEPVQVTEIDVKEAIKNNCLTFGIFETAKKIQDFPEKIDALVDYLIEEDFADEAALVVKQVFGEETAKKYSDKLPVIPEDFTRNQMVNKHHMSLKGESLADSRRKLRALRKQKLQKQQEEKNQELIDSMPK